MENNKTRKISSDDTEGLLQGKDTAKPGHIKTRLVTPLAPTGAPQPTPQDAAPKNPKPGFGKKTAFGLFGIAGAGLIAELLMSMSPPGPDKKPGEQYTKPDINAALQECKDVNDKMSFVKAFETARQAEGQHGLFKWHGKVFNTLYKQEEDKLSPAEKHHFGLAVARYETQNHVTHQPISSPVIVIHDEAPRATHVVDAMSFKDAFAVAREEVGPGGVFTWHGHLYNTYTNEEFHEMTSEQKHDFVISLGDLQAEHANISAGDVDIVRIDHGASTVPVDSHSSAAQPAATDNTEHFLSENWVDDGDGNKIHVGTFLVNGETVIKIDQDGDGNYDMEITRHEDGSVHIHDDLTGKDQDLTSDQFSQLMHGDSIVSAVPGDTGDTPVVHQHEPQVADHHAGTQNAGDGDAAPVAHTADTPAANTPTETTVEAHSVNTDVPAPHDNGPGGDFDPNANMSSFDV